MSEMSTQKLYVKIFSSIIHSRQKEDTWTDEMEE
jgi:hypothetical protein